MLVPPAIPTRFLIQIVVHLLLNVATFLARIHLLSRYLMQSVEVLDAARRLDIRLRPLEGSGTTLEVSGVVGRNAVELRSMSRVKGVRVLVQSLIEEWLMFGGAEVHAGALGRYVPVAVG